MNLYTNNKYMEDLFLVANEKLPWEKLEGKSLMISGATGLIGSFLIDVILEKNKIDNLNCKIYALGRNEKKARERFFRFYKDENFNFISYDVKKTIIKKRFRIR